ncbi:MAG: permease-like cell division protein FtsX [Gammaproteobacteria bacterium]|nr:permease-like cell division protein FtsX [Gammaproteobacteria bacterium]MDH5735481.1 permease-like cell division protein FtsX [Gammaproteobacteria bacterium]
MAKFESSNQVARNSPVKAYFIHHIRTLISSLGFLTRNGLSTVMTMTVIAIALALPSGLYVFLTNISHVSVGWDNSAQISLFLKSDVTEKQAQQLVKKLNLYEDIKTVKLIHKDDALEEFQRISGFGEALESLGKNPLPHVIAAQPKIDPQRADKIQHLLKELRNLKEVDIAQLDLQWVKRLYSMLEIAHRGIWVISVLLALAVLLVVGNTIRLDIQNRRAEIEVTKLIGATNAFIRRPFLYSGLWYGLSGGVLAWILTSISIGLMENSVEQLASLYNSGFQLQGLYFNEAMTLIGFSCSLGLLGSWIAVSRHLHEIEPS